MLSETLSSLRLSGSKKVKHKEHKGFSQSAQSNLKLQAI